MGHVINPISFRLGFNRYWKSSWGVAGSNMRSYGYLVNQDFFVKKLIFSFFDQWEVQSSNIVASDVRIIRKSSSVDLFVYMYDSTWEEFLGDIYYLILDAYRYSNLSRKNLKYKRRARIAFKTRQIFFKSKFKKNRYNSNYIRRVPGSVKFWDRKFLLRKAIKAHKAFKITRKHFKFYLKSLFIFYITYIRMHVQRPLIKYIKHMLLYNLYKFFAKDTDIRIFFIGLTNDTITAAFISKFIAIKLERSYFLFRVLGRINRALRLLMKKRLLIGYRLKISGRYSRKQKAMVLLNGIGSFSRSRIDARVDYSFNIARLRYSVCGIKVWFVYCPQDSFLQKLKFKKLAKLKIRGRSKTIKIRRKNIRKLSGRKQSFLIL